jgi:hypothetical protein
MDSQTFDRLTTSVAAGVTRRQIAKGLLAGGAAGMLALLGARQSEAASCQAGCKARCADKPEPRACRAICLCECGIDHLCRN